MTVYCVAGAEYKPIFGWALASFGAPSFPRKRESPLELRKASAATHGTCAPYFRKTHSTQRVPVWPQSEPDSPRSPSLQSLNTESTEHLRDLCVKPLLATEDTETLVRRTLLKGVAAAGASLAAGLRRGLDSRFRGSDRRLERIPIPNDTSQGRVKVPEG